MSIVTLKLDKEAAELIHGILNEAMHQKPWIERRDEIEEIQDMIATQFGWPTWDEIRGEYGISWDNPKWKGGDVNGEE